MPLQNCIRRNIRNPQNRTKIFCYRPGNVTYITAERNKNTGLLNEAVSKNTFHCASIEGKKRGDEAGRGLVKTWREHGNVNMLRGFFQGVSDAAAAVEMEQFSGLLLQEM